MLIMVFDSEGLGDLVIGNGEFEVKIFGVGFFIRYIF